LIQVYAKGKGKGKDDDHDAALDRVPSEVHAPRQTRKGGSKPRRKMMQGRAHELGMNNPSRLRILGGTARGRRLDSPAVYLRPMMGKVREALFSSLTSLGVYGFTDRPVRHLDLFSGSGSVGLEALSRGASHATFVDFASECVATVLKNAAWCGFEDQVRAVEGDVLAVLADPASFGIDHPFEVVTITPPYEEVSYKELIRLLANSPVVYEDTLVIIEYPVELGNLPRVMQDGKLVGLRNRKYGRTLLGYYVVKPTGLYDVEPRVEEFLDV